MEKKTQNVFVMCVAVGMFAGAILISMPVSAHHGTAVSYDSSKPITLTGKVTEFVYKNPHAQLYFDVQDASGKVVHWSGELNSPGNLRQDGWSKDTFKAGDEVTITLHPSRAGAPVGNVDRSKPVVLNGKELPGRARNNDQ